MMTSDLDETFWELTLDDLREMLEQAVKTRAKKPQTGQLVIQTPRREIIVTIESLKR